MIYGQKQKEIADSNPFANTVSADAGICGQEKRTEAENLQGKTESVFPFLFFAIGNIQQIRLSSDKELR